MTLQKYRPPVFYPRLSIRDLENWLPFGLGVQIGLGLRDGDRDDQPWGVRNEDAVSRQCSTA